MKRSLADTTPDCFGSSRNPNKHGSEMTVFERQQTQFKFLQQQHHQSSTSDTQYNMYYDITQKTQAAQLTNSLTRGDIGSHDATMMLDHWLGWPEFGQISMPKEMFHSSSDCENKYTIETSTLTAAHSTGVPYMTATPDKEGGRSVATPMSNLDIVKLSLKKRKLDRCTQPKFVPDGVAKDNGSKRCVKDDDSNIIPQSIPGTGTTNIRKEVSADVTSEVTKPDYIQVRARRGQATDSHSLAERARREKISQKMRLLQDLVPGCSKITGKMGMLDEIINYVQALQCQVEFLSMKLAKVTTTINFSNGKILSAEVPTENAPRYPRVAMPDESSHANLPLNHIQAPTMMEIVLNSLSTPQSRTTNTPAFVHDNFLESSAISPFPTWDADFQAVSGLDYHQ